MTLLFRAASCQAIIIGFNGSDPVEISNASVDANGRGSPWSGVGSVIVRMPGRSGIYSGVMVGRSHVLTAAHVVSGASAADIEFQLNPGGDVMHRYRAKSVIVHPDYSGFNANRPNDDLAIIRLDQDVARDVVIHVIHKEMLARGELLTLVGYGGGGDGFSGETIAANPALKRVGYNRADAFDTDDEGGMRFEVYQFDFDGPDPEGNRIGGHSLGTLLEATVGGGDSGSAAFIHDGSGWRLAGINTFRWANPQGRMGVFGSGGGGILLSGYHEWIERVLLRGDEPLWHRHRLLLAVVAVGLFFVITGLSRWRRIRHQLTATRTDQCH